MIKEFEQIINTLFEYPNERPARNIYYRCPVCNMLSRDKIVHSNSCKLNIAIKKLKREMSEIETTRERGC